MLDDTDADTDVQIAPKFKNTDAAKWFDSWSDVTKPFDPTVGIKANPATDIALAVSCSGASVTALFTTATDCYVEFVIHDISGSEIVRTPRCRYSAGSHSVRICRLPEKGIYLCTMNAVGRTMSSKFTVY